VTAMTTTRTTAQEMRIPISWIPIVMMQGMPAMRMTMETTLTTKVTTALHSATRTKEIATVTKSVMNVTTAQIPQTPSKMKRSVPPWSNASRMVNAAREGFASRVRASTANAAEMSIAQARRYVLSASASIPVMRVQATKYAWVERASIPVMRVLRTKSVWRVYVYQLPNAKRMPTASKVYALKVTASILVMRVKAIQYV